MVIAGIFVLLAVVYLALVWSARSFTRSVEEKYPRLGKLVNVEGSQLHYVEKGRGRPVVLLHGDGGSVYDWLMSPLFDALAQKYRVIAFDRPGLGYSRRPKDGWSPRVQARLIHAALARLEIDCPLLVGHSRGGTVLLAYLVQYPQAVAAAVGLAPGGYTGEMRLLRVLNLPIIGSLLLYGLVIPLARRGRFKLHRANLDRFAFAPDRPVPQDYLDAYASLMTRPSHARAYAADLSMAGGDTAWLVQRYPQVRTPLLIVQGDADRNVPLVLSERLQRDIPGARLIVLPGTGHELQFNRPVEVAQAIDQAWDLANSAGQPAPAQSLVEPAAIEIAV